MAVKTKRAPANDGKLQILSLAGGGFMGLFTACVLEAVERDAPSFYDKTDLFAGTSIGAVIALGLAAKVPASKIKTAMLSEGPKIFTKGAIPLVGAVKKLSQAAYDAKPLRNVIEAITEKKKLGDLNRAVIVPAVDLTTGKVRIFRGGDGPDANIAAADVALASAAAPTYFPVHSIDNSLYADGGLIANAPDALAATEALHRMAGRRGLVRLLAIGTTRYSPALAGNAKPQDWGKAQWIEDLKILKFSMAAQVDLARRMAAELLGEEMILTVDPMLTSKQNDIVGLDETDAPAIEALQQLADAAYRELLDQKSGKQFLALWRSHTRRKTRARR